MRPNQIFAVSLPHALLDRRQSARVVDVVEWELLTPYGLRTLAPRDPNYRGRYAGDPTKRDGAYHQGTVWPWLLGPFIRASIRWGADAAAARRRAATWLAAFERHLHTACLGSISEILDGDAPHTPRGAVAQAWSVAELLRVAVDDLHVRM